MVGAAAEGNMFDFGLRKEGAWWGRGCCCSWRALMRGNVLLDRPKLGKESPLLLTALPRGERRERVLLAAAPVSRELAVAEGMA